MDELSSQLPYNPQKFQSRIVFENGQQKTILFAFAEGQGLKEHTTAHDVLLVVLEGSCTFSMQGEAQELQAGQVYTIPATVPHALTALSDFKMILIK